MRGSGVKAALAWYRLCLLCKAGLVKGGMKRKWRVYSVCSIPNIVLVLTYTVVMKISI
jgi:hypothetical protein